MGYGYHVCYSAFTSHVENSQQRYPTRTHIAPIPAWSGYRFRLHGALPVKLLAALSEGHKEIRLRGGKLPGSPDLVFSARRCVIFMNGCFWHGHDCRVGQHRPSSNSDYWHKKLDAKITRDQRNRQDLKILGWQSLTIWECELESPDAVLARVEDFLGPLRCWRPFQ